MRKKRLHGLKYLDLLTEFVLLYSGGKYFQFVKLIWIALTKQQVFTLKFSEICSNEYILFL